MCIHICPIPRLCRAGGVFFGTMAEVFFCSDLLENGLKTNRCIQRITKWRMAGHTDKHYTQERDKRQGEGGHERAGAARKPPLPLSTNDGRELDARTAVSSTARGCCGK